MNAVAPTFIATPGTKKWLDDSAFRFSVRKRILLERIGKPEEVAGLVAYLASEEVAFVTGANISINGGQHMF